MSIITKRIGIGLLLLSCFTCFLFFGSRQTFKKFAGSDDAICKYYIHATLDVDVMKLTCEQTVAYTNREKEDLSELYFHLYPNAFKTIDRAPVIKDEISEAYPRGFAAGYITLEEAAVNGGAVKYTIGGEDDTLLKLVIPASVKQHATAVISFRYTVQLPPFRGRFGYGENSINVAKWYPQLCVYDENGWNQDPYYKIGDPFYSDAADYHVELDVPEKYVVAHTGEQVSYTTDSGRGKYCIQAELVRDFAWFASAGYEMVENITEGTSVKAYSFNGKGKKPIEIGTKALQTFNELFGKYPYASLAIVQSDFYIGGMEYPQIVQIDGDAFAGDEFWMEYLIAHEIAHQWWYGLVGSNESAEPWLDEALTEYSTLLYFEKNYGKESVDNIVKNYINSSISRSGNTQAPLINKPVYGFEDWQQYSTTIYSSGALFHHELRKKVGDKAYFKMLKSYYETYKYKNATTADLVKLANRVCRQDLRAFFRERLGIIE